MPLCFIEPHDAIRVIAESMGREARRQLVGAERVREHVTTWPGVTRIEVRRCRCGRTLARKAAGRVGDSATEPFAPAGSAPVGQPDPR